ncbi:ABC transporter substrate-binding protein [Natronorubrum halophilum]|uniref:ABC transporter substrate-binding protein n=1 Tax=Natronorubrum halophilum TaxID=1702106 RepID=UPI0010C1A6A1|nr:ABC transporter substrate-binding protein [Natronorubrum halophilum]
MTDRLTPPIDRRTALKTTLGIGTLAIAGCLGSADQDSFRIGAPWDVTRDPLDGGSAHGGGILQRLGIIEALVGVSDDAEPEPALATDWERVDDVSWEFALRDGVVFHDDTELTADATVTSLERTVSSSAFADVPIEAVDATDQSTIVVETETAFAPLPAHLSRPEATIISPEAIEGDGVTEPISTGPFVFESFDPGSELRAIRNDDYYGETPTVESVRYEVVEDDQTRRLKLENGELEMARELPQGFAAALEETDGVDVYTPAIPRIRFVTFDTRSAPFDDERVRNAVSRAIDRESITESVLEGVDSPAIGPISSEMGDWADPSIGSTHYDPDRARELLSDAGWTTESDGVRTNDGSELSIDCYTYNSRELPVIGEVIQNQLAEVGIEFDLTVVEYGAMIDRVSQKSFDMYLTSWGTLIYPDPDRLADMFHSEGGLYHGWKHEEVDTLLDEARRLEDLEERRTRYHDVQTIVLDEAPIAVLTNYTNVIATAAAVHGYEPHPTETTYRLENVEVEG